MTYHVRVATLDEFGAGTNRNVVIKFSGSDGINENETSDITLGADFSQYRSANFDQFERGNVDEYDVTAEDVGRPFKLSIRIDGGYPGQEDWGCNDITINRKGSDEDGKILNEPVKFVFHKWLKSTGQIEDCYMPKLKLEKLNPLQEVTTYHSTTYINTSGGSKINVGTGYEVATGSSSIHTKIKTREELDTIGFGLEGGYVPPSDKGGPTAKASFNYSKSIKEIESEINTKTETTLKRYTEDESVEYFCGSGLKPDPEDPKRLIPGPGIARDYAKIFEQVIFTSVRQLSLDGVIHEMRYDSAILGKRLRAIVPLDWYVPPTGADAKEKIKDRIGYTEAVLVNGILPAGAIQCYKDVSTGRFYPRGEECEAFFPGTIEELKI
jgi:hypothetical protein